MQTFTKARVFTKIKCVIRPKTNRKHELKKGKLYLSSTDAKKRRLNIYHQHKGLNGLKGVNANNKISLSDKMTYYTFKIKVLNNHSVSKLLLTTK